ncbi:hypothetical protein [Streptomyces sp. NPDC093094]
MPPDHGLVQFRFHRAVGGPAECEDVLDVTWTKYGVSCKPRR